jgi:hypothetical protein
MNSSLQQADSSTSFGGAVHEPGAFRGITLTYSAPECGMHATPEVVTGVDQEITLYQPGD